MVLDLFNRNNQGRASQDINLSITHVEDKINMDTSTQFGI